ncbi:methionine adenosyltransferase [Mesomycoplasma hyorhinis]|uniref:methionine adenosyltransferase n=1 Tax=Mesomycoplasma hyorhinis TaxID=2100 RepID=UPI001C05EB01|nr:methionine adenosyltransferase [Mesomycoplasma hyorhinis]
MLMLKRRHLSVSESVGKGHPDKICDQISDSILDAILTKDPNARVAVEVMASNRLIIIGGEVSTKAYVDVVKTAWKVVFAIGYNENDFTIISNVNTQSADIAKKVDKSDTLGAGDQGVVYGYACSETKNFYPLSASLAHALTKYAEELRSKKKFPYAKADMKSQVEVDFSNWEQPKIVKMIMSVQHEAKIDDKKFKQFIHKDIMQKIAQDYGLNLDFETIINPGGQFVIGGTIGDTGLTGRKIIVDSYGDRAHHGGGAFSGKDYTKVDRSGAYFARWIAKNLVAAGVAKELEIQLSFAIGIAEPISISVEQIQAGKFSEEQIVQCIKNVFNTSVKGFVEDLELRKPIYKQTATYGHFGRNDIDLPWERLNKVKQIKEFLKI